MRLTVLHALPAAADGADARRPDRRVLAMGALLITLLSVGVSLVLWRSREDALHTWRLYLTSFAATAVEHATQSVYTVESVLDSVVDRVQAQGYDTPDQAREALAQRAMSTYLAERVAQAPTLDLLAVTDIDGNVRGLSRGHTVPGLNVSDRDFFQAHRADPHLELHISAPVLNRTTQRWTVHFSRKLRSRTGTMIGLAVAGIEVDHFQALYRSLGFDGPGVSVSLYRRDGVLLARHPPRPEALGRSYHGAAAFEALDAAQHDGRRWATVFTDRPRLVDAGQAQPRLVAAHQAERLPLVVVAAVTEDLMLREWRGTAVTVGVATLAVDALVAALTVWLRALLRRRRAELASLEKAHAAAESANLVKSQFLADMSHEIRTPLHGMLGMTHLLLEGELSDPQRTSIDLIERSGHLLLQLIDDVLDFSRIEAGRLQLERLPVDLSRLAADCMALHAALAREKGVAFALEMDDGPAWVLGDSLRLGQVINNLLSNAIKFTAAGVVTLALSRCGSGRWRLAVRDTGIGMTREQAQRIGLPFAQADVATPGRFGATGLGLSIVNRLVQLHGGELGVDSVPGRGCEFSCVLELPDAPQAPPVTPAQASLPARPRRGALRVLVAEDDPVNMLVSCALLRKLGITVLQATDGRAAVALRERERPDVILMDVHMPGLDGVEATRAIRAIERAHAAARTPIAALTANVLPEDRARCLEAGMDDVLVKPFDSQRLAELLSRLTGQPLPVPPVLPVRAVASSDAAR